MNPQSVKMVEEFKKKKKDAEFCKTEEFNKQPPQTEFLKPKTGVNILFGNGIKKEGEKKASETRMTREDYNKMIENLPNRFFIIKILLQKLFRNIIIKKFLINK